MAQRMQRLCSFAPASMVQAPPAHHRPSLGYLVSLVVHQLISWLMKVEEFGRIYCTGHCTSCDMTMKSVFVARPYLNTYFTKFATNPTAPLATLAVETMMVTMPWTTAGPATKDAAATLPATTRCGAIKTSGADGYIVVTILHDVNIS